MDAEMEYPARFRSPPLRSVEIGPEIALERRSAGVDLRVAWKLLPGGGKRDDGAAGAGLAARLLCISMRLTDNLLKTRP
jgi:hypothetical protein